MMGEESKTALEDAVEPATGGVDAGRAAAAGGEKIDYRARRAEQALAEKRLRRFVGLLLLAAVLVVGVTLFSYSVMQSRATGLSPADSYQAAADAQQGAHALVDSAGRSVQVPDEPQHIAVMDSFSSEFAVMIGAGERLCGVPGGTKSDALLQEMCPSLSKASQLSGNMVNIDELASQGCDLAIVKTSMAQTELAKLDRMGIPYVVVDYATVDEQLEAMELVGQACGGSAEQKAQSLVSYYRSVRDDVQRRVAGVADSERASVYHSINDALLTDGEGSLGASWIAEAGCVDVSAGMEATSGSDYNATLEQVYTWNPDLVICNSADAASSVKAEAQWAGLQAVRDGKVQIIPTGATRWGHRGSAETCMAELWLGMVAYPDLFTDVDLKQTVIAYYRDYLGLSIDDDTYAKILAGEGIRTSGGGTGQGSGGGDGSGGGNGNGGGRNA